ncbi:Leishmanolysin peptidase [Fasciola gigantica]|uniref:Leishmanolysin-like peptidase n=1 Tax=Fasciola gigantica TaxID=46835 RepID=A0A504Y6J7_FASGI|nr:Leishmanolysin peptidase [Fasciola gigantica]
MVHSKKTLYYMLIGTIILYPLSAGYSHVCRTPPARTLYHVNEGITNLETKNSERNFRITAIYTNGFYRNVHSERIKKEIVEFAISHWSSVMKPKKPFQGTFRAARGCINNRYELHQDSDGQIYEYCLTGCQRATDCFAARIPKYLMDKCRMMVDGKPTVTEEAPGIGEPNTDYVLFVDATDTDLCREGTLAYTAICQTESTLDRPSMGYINFCSKAISLDFPHLRISRDTALHEMAHAFGFHDVLFAFMRTENGEPRTPRDNRTGMPTLGTHSSGAYIPSEDVLEEKTMVWKSARGTYNRTRTLLKTPKLLETARKHFGCPSLDGVELENQGGSGTASAHFEKRIYLNELMVGSIAFDAVMSPFVLAFFQDSGGQSILPWCNEASLDKTSCLSYANAFGLCNLRKRVRLRKLPEQNQYFASIKGVPERELSLYGGEDSLADFCPYWAPEVLIENGPSTYCDHVENSKFENRKNNHLLEGYGSSARCFSHDQTQAWNSYQCKAIQSYSPTTASCHKFECVNGSGLAVLMDQKRYICPARGGSIQVDTVGKTAYVKGRLECPACNTVCGTECPSSDIQATKPDPPPEKIPCPSTGIRLRLLGSIFFFVFSFSSLLV